MTGSSKKSLKKIAAIIKLKFKKTGENAGAENLPNVFNTPPNIATTEIKNMYGKVIFKRSEAKLN